MVISMLKIRRPLGRLIFNMGIAIPGKTVFLIETAPWLLPCQSNLIICLNLMMILTSNRIAKSSQQLLNTEKCCLLNNCLDISLIKKKMLGVFFFSMYLPDWWIHWSLTWPINELVVQVAENWCCKRSKTNRIPHLSIISLREMHEL